jgi:hypothetical protein
LSCSCLVIRTALLASFALAALTLPALAQTEDLQWLSPPADIQLQKDPTLVPVGRGAVLVPTMSDPLLEPAVSLRQNGKEVRSKSTGTRLIADPGNYEVQFGSGGGQGRVRRSVTVREGKTTVVKPDWSGLRVQVVDENAVPWRGLYELIALPAMENRGVGHGAQVEQGESLLTWVMEPGLYMLLKVGESYQARQNFYTVRLRPGYLEQVTLVVDPKTGDFLGAGEMTIHGNASKVHRDLLLSGIVGGGVSVSSQTNVTGVVDRTEMTPSFYFDLLAQFAPGKHYFYGRFNSEEAFTQLDWGHYVKNTDFVRLDTLYAYRLLQIMGPYARFGLETTLFPGFLYFDDPRTVAPNKGQGASGTKVFRISDPFLPLTLKPGAGLRFNTLPSPWINLWALVGVGGRFVSTGTTFKAADIPATDDEVKAGDLSPYEVEAVDSFRSYGIESTLVLNLSLTRWVIATTEFEGFVPFNDFTEPQLRWDNNLGLRITSFISVNYIYRLKYEPEFNEKYQHDHQVQLRFSYKFF